MSVPDTSAPASAPEPATDSSRSPRRWRALMAHGGAGAIVTLNVLYLVVGDRTAWGEYLTIWPPVLWLAMFVVVAAPLLWRLPRTAGLPLLAAMMLFAVTLLDWRPLLRVWPASRREGTVRVLTWNIAGNASKQHVLGALAAAQPDIVLLQETPDGAASFTDADLTGYWQGFAWIDAGDCGILSRWPLRELPTQSVGPWSQPQIVAVDGPWERPLLVVNVRLMLPSLELLPVGERARRNLVESNAERVAQYPRLMDVLLERDGEADYGDVVLGGDFNVDASARSLGAVRRHLADAWPRAGRGWGATITSDFPVGRIDHLYTWVGTRVVDARVLDTSLSDHRPLWADLVIE